MILPRRKARPARFLRPAAALSLLLAALPCPGQETRRLLDVDLYGRLNPSGLLLAGTAAYLKVLAVDPEYKVPSASVQWGGGLAAAPSAVQFSAHLEAQPVLFARIRVEGDLNRYLGQYWSLLSFQSGASPYGQDLLDARKGQEEAAWGSRLLVQPTLQGKAGPFLLRNQTDWSWFRFQGKGPFFWESENDFLLKDGDAVLANRTQALLPVPFKGGTLFAGPFYLWAQSRVAHQQRRRIGLMGFWDASASRGRMGKPRLLLQLGYNLQDPTRNHEVTVLMGAGASF